MEENLLFAKYQIGILEMLQEKTKGNLDREEELHLENTLHTLRMAFIDVGNKEQEKQETPKEEAADTSEKNTDK